MKHLITLHCAGGDRTVVLNNGEHFHMKLFSEIQDDLGTFLSLTIRPSSQSLDPTPPPDAIDADRELEIETLRAEGQELLRAIVNITADLSVAFARARKKF